MVNFSVGIKTIRRLTDSNTFQLYNQLHEHVSNFASRLVRRRVASLSNVLKIVYASVAKVSRFIVLESLI